MKDPFIGTYDTSIIQGQAVSLKEATNRLERKRDSMRGYHEVLMGFAGEFISRSGLEVMQMGEPENESINKAEIMQQIEDLSELLGMTTNDDTITVYDPVTTCISKARKHT